MAVLSVRPRRPASLFAIAEPARISQEEDRPDVLFSSAKHGRCPTSTTEALLREPPLKPHQHGPHREEQAQASCPRSCREDGDFHAELLLRTMCETGQLDRALLALSRMHKPPSVSTYLSILKACSKSKSLPHAKQVYGHLTLHRAHLTGFLGDYLVMTLAKCGAVDDARQLSSTLPHLTVFSWTAIIFAYAESGRGLEALETYQCMQKDGVDPDSFTFVSLFKACGSIPDLGKGKKLHSYARIKGLASNTFVGNTIVSMYGKCGALREAEDAFGSLSHHDTVSWNGMLSACVEHGQGAKALRLYRQMQEEGTSPDQATFVIAFHACGTLGEEEDSLDASRISMKEAWIDIGRALHADARRKNFVSNVLVGTAMLSMYGKCGTFVEAEIVFNTLAELDTVAWNAMLSVYVEHEQGEKAMCLYVHMQKQGASPDHMTYVIALQACGTLGEKEETLLDGKASNEYCLEIGQALHTDVRSKGYATHAPIANTLVSMYGKCGTLAEAEDVFSALFECDVVSWNAMISACIDQGQGEKAICLYRKMQEECLTLNEVTLICILQACSEVGTLELCEKLHFSIVSAGLDRISPLAATLINAYGSCASMVDAEAIFDDFAEPNVVTWNACIAGHAGDGNSRASLHMFENLRLSGIKPSKVTFTSVLSACSHSGLVVKGLEYFESMIIDNGITSERTHHNIMIDLLGRAGDFKRIESMLGRMPMLADLTIWLCLLGACSTHGNLELGKQAFDHAVHMQPKQGTAYVLMSNIYADAGLPDCVAEVENSIEGL